MYAYKYIYREIGSSAFDYVKSKLGFISTCHLLSFNGGLFEGIFSSKSIQILLNCIKPHVASLKNKLKPYN